MEPVSIITFDLSAAAAPPVSAINSPAQVSVFDLANFEALHASQPVQFEQNTQALSATTETSGFQTALDVLQSLNNRSEVMGTEALKLSAEGKDLSPGEMLSMTMHAHQFLFQSQLTANIANRTSEGVQQLFRQQS